VTLTYQMKPYTVSNVKLGANAMQ